MSCCFDVCLRPCFACAFTILCCFIASIVRFSVCVCACVSLAVFIWWRCCHVCVSLFAWSRMRCFRVVHDLLSNFLRAYTSYIPLSYIPYLILFYSVPSFSLASFSFVADFFYCIFSLLLILPPF